MKNLAVLSFLCVSLLVALGSCKNQKKVSDEPVDPAVELLEKLQGKWSLIELDGKNVHQSNAFLEIADTLATAYSGCNTMSNIKVSTKDHDNNLTLDCSKSPTTLVGCPVFHIEPKYFDLITKSYRVFHKGKVIVITNNTGIEMLFVKS